jgi:hypothetical protein
MSEPFSDTLVGKWGDYPIKGTAKVTAPVGFYFASIYVVSDTVVSAAEVSGVAYTGSSYNGLTMPAGIWHPIMAKVTAITLSSGELQAWLKPL